MALNAITVLLVAIATTKLALATSVDYSGYYCYPPTGPQYGGYTPKKNHYGVGYSIEYYCNDGYELVGGTTATCAYDNVAKTAGFSISPPICRKKVIRCPTLKNPQYGSVSVSDYTPGSTAHYQCQDGYKLKGSDYRTCRYDGTWNGRIPTCIPSVCPYLNDPRNGHVVVKDRTPRSEAHYECDKGYKLVGVAYRRCLDDCTWSEEAPTCKLIRCRRLSAPDYGRVTTKGNTPGKTTHYSCVHGYKLVGDPYRTCNYDGSWSGEAPTCAPIKCVEHDAPQYGSVSYTGYSPRSRANYRCNNGYKLVGLKYRICSYDGIWGGDKPTCIPSKCPNLDNIEYGVVTVPSYGPGGRAHYVCNKGYKLVGNAYRICQDDCTWNGRIPKCIPIKCPRHDAPQYGTVDFNGYRPTHRVHYGCDYGYKLVGLKYRTCGYDGVWSGDRPRCIPARCPRLEDIEYGKVTVPSYGLKGRAHYTCYKGYKLVGEAYRTCQDDCEWDGEPPRCVPARCPRLEDIEYGQVTVPSYGLGGRAHYTCYKGYKLVGDPYRTCQDDCEWDGEPPRCVPARCPRLEDIEYGKVTVPSYGLGGRAHYTCYKGYKLVGDPYRTCQDDCEWDGEPPRCVPARCPRLEDIEYGQVTIPSYGLGGRAHYTCYKGYKLVGDAYRTCQDDCTWNGEPPKCIPIKCPSHDGPQYGSVRFAGYRPTHRVHYTCNSGYKLVGLKYRTCGYDGVWDGEKPTCIPSKCPNLDNIEYGVVTVPSYGPGGRAHYVCNKGYKLVGRPYRTCQKDCTWSGKQPKCIIVKCPSLPDIRYGGVNVTENGNNATAYYGCLKGYKLVGDSYRRCEYGIWMGKAPRCKPLKCRRLSAPRYGKVQTKAYTVGSKSEYSCNYGYRLVGESTRTCLYNEQWGGKEPTCEPITCQQPHNIDHGQVYASSLKVASRASYKCDYGYKLVGSARRRCQDDGTWSGEAPICKRK